jgi:AcrR family transcriptional regulator
MEDHRPLFERLPHGPHSLSDEQVARSQRVRSYAAMIEAIRRHGYPRTTVAETIKLANISRRSFYECFASKEECFLALCCVVITRYSRQIGRACQASDGGIEDSLTAGLAAIAAELRADPALGNVLIVEAPAAGLIADDRVQAHTFDLEQMIGCAFARASRSDAFSPVLAKGILGGLQRIAYLSLRDRELEEFADVIEGLAGEATDWAASYVSPAAARLRICPYEPFEDPIRAPWRRRSSAVEDRNDLMRTMLEIANEGRFFELSERWIAAKARVASDWLTAMPGDEIRFSSKEDCYAAAFEVLRGEILGVLRRHLGEDGSSEERGRRFDPEVVYRAIGALLGHFVANPMHARTIAVGAFAAGRDAADRNIGLSHEVSCLLTRGSNPQASDFLLDAIGGAIWHLVACGAEGGSSYRPRYSLLNVWDPLAYIVLAPLIGVERAIWTIERA